MPGRGLPLIQAIYAHHVLNGVASFEEVPPDLAEMDRRREEVLRPRPALPGGGARRRGPRLSPMPASSARARPTASRSRTRSMSAPDAIGHGFGRASLAEVIRRCTALGMRQMVAVIGDAPTAPRSACTRAWGSSGPRCSGGRLQARPLGGRRHDAAAARRGRSTLPPRESRRRLPQCKKKGRAAHGPSSGRKRPGTDRRSVPLATSEDVAMHNMILCAAKIKRSFAYERYLLQSCNIWLGR